MISMTLKGGGLKSAQTEVEKTPQVALEVPLMKVLLYEKPDDSAGKNSWPILVDNHS